MSQPARMPLVKSGSGRGCDHTLTEKRCKSIVTSSRTLSVNSPVLKSVCSIASSARAFFRQPAMSKICTRLHITNPKHTIRRLNRLPHTRMGPSTLVHTTKIWLSLIKRTFTHTSRESRQPSQHRQCPAGLAIPQHPQQHRCQAYRSGGACNTVTVCRSSCGQKQCQHLLDITCAVGRP